MSSIVGSSLSVSGISNLTGNISSTGNFTTSGNIVCNALNATVLNVNNIYETCEYNNSQQGLTGSSAISLYDRTGDTGQITLGNTSRSLAINSYINSGVNLDSSKLTIYQPFNTGSTDALLIRDTPYIDGSPNYIKLGLLGNSGSGFNNAYIDTGRVGGNGSDLIFRLNGTEYMRLTNQYTSSSTTGGYLGINKSNPSYPLDVSGSAQISGVLSSGSLNTPSLTCNTIAPYSGSSVSINASTISETATTSLNMSAPVINLTSSGNLNFNTSGVNTFSGAGTTIANSLAVNKSSAFYNLDVSGNANISSTLYANSGVSCGGNSYLNNQYLYLQNNTDMYLQGSSGNLELKGFFGGKLSANTNASNTTALTWDLNGNVSVPNATLSALSGSITNGLACNTISPQSSATTLNLTHANVALSSSGILKTNEIQGCNGVNQIASVNMFSNVLSGVFIGDQTSSTSGFTIYANNIKSNTNQLLYTSTIPTLLSSMMGYVYSAQTSTSVSFTNGTIKLCQALTVNPGVYSVNFSITYFNSSTSTGSSAPINIQFGISNSSSSFASGSSACCYKGISQSFTYGVSGFSHSYICQDNLFLNTSAFGSNTINLLFLCGSNSIATTQNISDSYIQLIRIA